MPTVLENLSLIRQRLKQPNPHAPSDLQLLNILVEHINDHCAQLQNTRNHWSIGWTDLTVSAGNEDYLITAQDFGRPFLVYTDDPTDSFHQRREIPFSLLQDTDQRYQGPEQAGGKWSATQISFYRTSPGSPSVFARPTPIPNEEANYKIGYEANYEFGSLGDNPGLSPFHHLIRVQTALSSIALCEWGEISILKNPEAWQMQANALRDTFLHDEAIYQKRFDSYKAQSTREGVTQKLGVGHCYEEEWGYGGSIVTGYGW